MLDRSLATELRATGLRWSPVAGDRFVVPDRDLDDQVFTVSDMVIEAVEMPQGQRILAFNGTTEWALDSLEAPEAIWIPREDQLRALLGDAFVSLERVSGPAGGLVVTALVSGEPRRYVDVDAESAYARAVLERLRADPPAD